MLRRGRKVGVPKQKTSPDSQAGPRYSVGLLSTVAREVERYAQTVDASMSKAIASLYVSVWRARRIESASFSGG